MVKIKKYLPKLNKNLCLNSFAKRDLKFAFSLAEVLIGMLIMSLFFMATTKVISVKQKPLVQEYPHGYYECYNSGGYKEHRVDSGRNTITAGTTGVRGCTFVPPKGIPVFNVYLVSNTYPRLRDQVLPVLGGFYKRTEAQLTDDELNFPSGLYTIASLYDDIEEGDNDNDFAAIMKRNLSNGAASQFKRYLQMTYPDSVLNNLNWRETGGIMYPPIDAIFITW